MQNSTKTIEKLRLPTRKSPKIALRTVLILPFVLQILAAVGLTGYLSFRNGQQAVNDLANRLSTEVSDRIEQHLDTYFATPQHINQINADAIELGHINPQNLPKLGHYFWKQMQVFNVGYIIYAAPEGNYAAAGYFLDPEDIIIDELSANTNCWQFSVFIKSTIRIPSARFKNIPKKQKLILSWRICPTY